MPDTIQDHQIKDELFEAVPWLGIGTSAWKVLRANAMVARWLGYANAQELIGLNVDDLVDPALLDKHKAGRTEWSRKPRIIPTTEGPEVGILCKDGVVVRAKIGIYGSKEMFDRGFVLVAFRPLGTVTI